MENVYDVAIDRAREIGRIRKNTKNSVKEVLDYKLKQHKAWFKQQFIKLLDQRRQAELQCFQNSNETNGDNLDAMKCD
jgi:hypothetical protein